MPDLEMEKDPLRLAEVAWKNFLRAWYVNMLSKIFSKRKLNLKDYKKVLKF